MPSCRKIRAASIVLLLKNKKKKRKMWVRDWILRRDDLGFQNQLLRELQSEDPVQLKNFLRMTEATFNILLNLIRCDIQRQDTEMRYSISAELRLLVTLRYLATGDSFHSLAYLFRIPVCTISRIVLACCNAVYRRLKTEYLKIPISQEEWLKVAKGFEVNWNYPHCIGALDGKHIRILAPTDAGSDYFNYKGFHSIVLLILVDADYKINYLNVGCNGRISDGGVFNQCDLSRALSNNTLNLPTARTLPGSNIMAPFVIVAEDAFALKPYLMKPYGFRGQPAQNRVFNYRLSRARNTVENVFGHLATRFRLLQGTINLSPSKAKVIISAICVLHNFLLVHNPNYLQSLPKMTSDNRQEFTVLQSTPAYNTGADAKQVRENFKDYFVSPEGEISWQYTKI